MFLIHFRGTYFVYTFVVTCYCYYFFTFVRIHFSRTPSRNIVRTLNKPGSFVIYRSKFDFPFSSYTGKRLKWFSMYAPSKNRNNKCRFWLESFVLRNVTRVSRYPTRFFFIVTEIPFLDGLPCSRNKSNRKWKYRRTGVHGQSFRTHPSWSPQNVGLPDGGGVGKKKYKKNFIYTFYTRNYY